MAALGSFVLVLHGHMPWVRHHGRWPHGEVWLLEAAVGVWLPLLGVLDELRARGLRAPMSLGLTPVLLEQLRSPGFARQLRTYLDDRLSRARADQSDPALAPVARYWEGRFSALRERFDAINGDLPGAFAAAAPPAHLELLGGFATHGYAALLKHDRSVRAQLELGLRTSERHFGWRPRGIWLPECSFRPTGPWDNPVLPGRRTRRGTDRILEEQGVTHFFVDTHLIEGARSEGIVQDGVFTKVDWDEAERDTARAWRSPLEPHRVGTHGGPATITAFCRHPSVSEQVWSADGGYPGDGRYLEFHKKKDGDGLPYWAVTDRRAGLGDKVLYNPAAAADAVQAHAAHMVELVRERLRRHHVATGRQGCVTASFDAELFGHWWFEGPAFLGALLARLQADPEITPQPADDRLRTHPPDKVAWLPEGSWGAGGDHRVWLNDRSRWMWEVLHRAEDRFLGLEWRTREAGAPDDARPLLTEAARELLLLQASDWPFVIHTGGAVDYGHRRFCEHLSRFDALCGMVDDRLAHRRLDALQKLRRQEAAASVPAFPGLDLRDWQHPTTA